MSILEKYIAGAYELRCSTCGVRASVSTKATAGEFEARVLGFRRRHEACDAEVK